MRTMMFARKKLQMILLIFVAITLGLTGSALAQHPTIDLLDADGNPIPATGGLQPAYSAAETCGGCHDYASIEQHSYHAQIGANQWKGWNNFNPNSSDKFKRGVAAKGKSWVQSPGHLGKW